MTKDGSQPAPGFYWARTSRITIVEIGHDGRVSFLGGDHTPRLADLYDGEIELLERIEPPASCNKSEK